MLKLELQYFHHMIQRARNRGPPTACKGERGWGGPQLGASQPCPHPHPQWEGDSCGPSGVEARDPPSVPQGWRPFTRV